VAAKLIHVLGGGPWQLRTVELAQAIGYRVLVTDMYAERPAYAIAELHAVADITDRQATLAIARHHQIDGILCDTTDVGVPTAAYVAEQLGLPGMGYEVALNFTNKSRMRQCAKQAGFAVPKFRLITVAEELPGASAALGYPVVVKPVDNQSGRGVGKVSDPAGLDAAFVLAKGFSRAGQVLIEECVDGVEIIVDGFMVAGQAKVLGLAYKTPYADAPTISSRILYPGGPPPGNAPAIHAATQAVISALGLQDGVFHAEFILCSDHVVPIDIAARGGGVMIYSHVLPHISGVDANQAMIRLTTGEAVSIEPLAYPKAANIEFMRMPVGRLSGICGIDAAKATTGVAAIHFNVSVGDQIGPLAHKDDRPGFIVVLADTAAAAIEASLQAKSCIKVLMDEDATPQPVF